MIKLAVFFLLLGFPISRVFAQVHADNKNSTAILMLRSEEDYSFLKENDSTRLFLKGLKLIPLNRKASLFLTLGGGYRPKMEHFTNKNYMPENETVYSQRIDFHIALNLGNRLKVFSEFYHGLITRDESIVESDHLDIHQAFLDWTLLKKDKSGVQLRLGRQEIGFGASRLVGIREGPNMRRSFDMVKINLKYQETSLDLFYGKEVQISPDAFDNRWAIFSPGAPNPNLWGAYFRSPFLNDNGMLDLYYLGFQSNQSAFNDIVGKELRHSIGIRAFGKRNKLSYNTELISQFGNIGDNLIWAYNIETDWKYMLSENFAKPTLGLKLDFSSGDQKANDGKIGTFNPMFVNPAIYSLAAINTPANLTGIHPNINFEPNEKISIYIDYAIFFRTQEEDGLYTPPRFLTRPSNGIAKKHIGDAIGLQFMYEFNRNIAFDLRASYFITGDFIEASGESENIFYLAPTMSFKF